MAAQRVACANTPLSMAEWGENRDGAGVPTPTADPRVKNARDGGIMHSMDPDELSADEINDLLDENEQDSGWYEDDAYDWVR
ncbi:hypothetical protein GCM10010359_21750 [Streptomyces morookaense]|nr:hypothetical protein GCM10010359_21750 [Streptomyces morookaense]